MLILGLLAAFAIPAFLSQPASGNSFSVIRGTDGRTSCSCSVEGASGCPSGGNWAG